jgi:hypothetical protein
MLLRRHSFLFSLALLTPPLHAQDGEQLYGLYCSACHSPDGKGANSGAFPPLAGSKWVHGNPKRSVAIILKGIHGVVDVSIAALKQDFGIVWKGDFMAPAEEEYEFQLDADDGARLVLNGHPVAEVKGFGRMNLSMPGVIGRTGAKASSRRWPQMSSP